ncbi:MAG TPA: hypothetical protein VFV96_10340 [Verrucomicrobiae bacterium]|nr:hypothetical protein [Verrucomicrobiae bacterium]
MSLGKLLATGRSLVSGPDAGRYQVDSRNRLPKFGSAKNPFASTTPAMPTSAESRPAEACEPELKLESATPLPAPQSAPPVEAAAGAATVLKKTQRIPELAGLSQRSFAAPGARAKSALRSLGARVRAVTAKILTRGRGWLGRLRTPRPATASKSVFPRLGKPAVQTELSLDNVKVMRNNLEESDLEIVTAPTATCTQVAPTEPVAAPNRGPVPTALKKMTGHMVSAKSAD